ncbi:MAG TPA: hypothetical protein VGB77_02765 [Abditibacteriaceae bacterium]|jgi:hypothetical protein
MALSFGRKKGQAAGEADNPNPDSGATSEAGVEAQPNSTTGRARNATEEPIDESWFETFSEEAATQAASAQSAPVPNASAAAPDFSVAPTTPQPQFSAYNTQNEDAPDEFGDFGSHVNLPPAQAARANSQTALDSGAFVDPSTGALSNDSATPFDTSSAATETAPPKESKGGGLKKLLPVLAVLLVLGGGGAFWYSQQGENEEELTELPAMTQPTGGGSTGAPPTTGAPTGSSTGAPTGAAPTGSKPTGAKPVTPNSAASGDPKTKMQLKKLWNDGLALRKQNKTAAAKAKWNEAVKLARSKAGHEKSAGMIQQAIDKLK